MCVCTGGVFPSHECGKIYMHRLCVYVCVMKLSAPSYAWALGL